VPADPALARLGAAIALGDAVPDDLTAAGVSARDVAPGRLAG
jgi:hypothetical protein